MSGLWEEYDTSTVVTAIGDQASVELFHNEVDDHIFASAPITIVDGILTVITNTDDLCKVKLVIAHESFNATAIAALGRHEPQNWYSWFCARGPLVFRMRSKKTIFPEHKLWMKMIKQRGTTATTVNVGLEAFMVRHQ